MKGLKFMTFVNCVKCYTKFELNPQEYRSIIEEKNKTLSPPIPTDKFYCWDCIKIMEMKGAVKGPDKA